jgi:hypothetical protein
MERRLVDAPSVVDGLMAAGAFLPAQMPSTAGGWSPELSPMAYACRPSCSDRDTLEEQR